MPADDCSATFPDSRRPRPGLIFPKPFRRGRRPSPEDTLTFDPSHRHDRRSFLGAFAAGTASLAGAALGTTAEARQVQQAEPWLAALRGKHRQVFDAPALNSGFPLMYVFNYLGTMTAHYQLPATEVGAMLVVRNAGIGLAISDDIWARYRLGTAWNVTDRSTGAAALRNPYLASRPGDLPNPNAAIDRLLSRGVVVGVCGLALRAMSSLHANSAGVTPEVAVAEWTASLLPGMHVVPSGVLAIGRAQESGATYCFAG